MTYDTHPTIEAGTSDQCIVGFEAIAAWIEKKHVTRVSIDAYPGVFLNNLERIASHCNASTVLNTETALLSPHKIDAMISSELTADPLFGKLSTKSLEDFFDADRLAEIWDELTHQTGLIFIIGPYASLFSSPGLLLYADLGRREATLRQRRHEVANFGSNNISDSPASMYKRSYFVDWRIADRHKQKIWDKIDAFLDTTSTASPLLVEAAIYNKTLASITKRPFRVVPWFDPAPWGGTWIQQHCSIGLDKPNLGWCFDCVPEENSLLLSFGMHTMDIPSLNLVLREPIGLLGKSVTEIFGAEFPIRTDFLDTMDGSNLSLQVHPLTAYMREEFGHTYTQDESYYILEAKAGATVHLGLQNGIRKEIFIAALRDAEEKGIPFVHKSFVNIYATKRHDHFLIPAGTLHGSGANTMVLEISATPYIFTFKMYDWLRPDLDGKMRPINIQRALDNFAWDRNETFCNDELVNAIDLISNGDSFMEEHTGLHATEFIETRRHSFSKPVLHVNNGRFAVINLVHGKSALVESPDNAFDPFPVEFAETFIIPDGAGDYIISPLEQEETLINSYTHATIKAYIRPGM